MYHQILFVSSLNIHGSLEGPILLLSESHTLKGSNVNLELTHLVLKKKPQNVLTWTIRIVKGCVPQSLLGFEHRSAVLNESDIFL